MKNKGRRYKRAVAAMKRYTDPMYNPRYRKGYIVSTTKKYFTALVFDSLYEKWEIHKYAYISYY